MRLTDGNGEDGHGEAGAEVCEEGLAPPVAGQPAQRGHEAKGYLRPRPLCGAVAAAAASTPGSRLVPFCSQRQKLPAEALRELQVGNGEQK